MVIGNSNTLSTNTFMKSEQGKQIENNNKTTYSNQTIDLKAKSNESIIKNNKEKISPDFCDKDSKERIAQIKADINAAGYSLCLERLVLLDEFWQKQKASHQKEHYLVERAMALAYVFSQRTPRIYDNELIIGNMSSKRVAANYYPEGTSIIILQDFFKLEQKVVPLNLDNSERKILLRLALRNFTKSIAWKALLSKKGRKHYVLNNMFNARRYLLTEGAGVSHQVANYHLVVSKGLVTVDEYCQSRLQSQKMDDGSTLNAEQLAFYQASRIIIAGIKKLAENLALAAEEMINSSQSSLKRKVELKHLAQMCRQVPYYPARSFQEGLQACWIIHIALNLEDFEQGISWGRLDQILYPLYLNDLEKGIITKESAIEMLASFQLKACETMPLFSENMDKYFSGNTVGQGITLGGLNEQGFDASNELSENFLDAYAQILTREPNLHVRINKQSPDSLLEKSIDLLLQGNGSPAFFGDQSIINALEHSGMNQKHARDYAVIGCVELGSQGRTYNSSDAALFNLPILLELALNEGKYFSAKFFSPRIGVKSKAPKQMATFEDLLQAYQEQVEFAVNECVQGINYLEETYRHYRSSPVNSILTEGCLQKGYDITKGAALYDYTSLQIVGLADVGDSLYAIKRLVYDEKRYTLSDFVKILKNNYKANEALRIELDNKFLRFGNAQAEVDKMFQLAADVFTHAVCKHKNTRGGKYLVGIYSMTCNIAFGKYTAASANGRLAATALSNGLSPTNGADRNGPTALFRSAATLNSINWGNCVALNIMFDKKQIQHLAGKKALAALLKSYLVDQGGMQVQINMLDADLLLQAKKNPLAYPGLLVRVAGYCAYFKDLTPEAQDEIIARSHHSV